MCDPVSIGIATIGLTAGSSALSFMSAKKDAQKAALDNKHNYEANKQAAIDAAMLNEHELSLRQSEEFLANSAQLQDMTRQETANLSTTTVSAAEAGVSGNSLDAVLADIKGKSSLNKTRLQENSQMRTDQLGRDKESVLVEAKNNIATVRQTNVRQPSILTPIFQTGAAALGAYDQYQQRQSKANGGSGG